ncbi:hypothetical protein [Endozoicomonas sp. SCSIO W0465]|uniref:hypothetical protein n=1 Tax=Endozoicomonas sp. SCSIO W0465 TaxID=2918516 RepID=UPI0020753753|nr:hypothetical protein [Endozoicomonas sp. SCSIO W0465]USE38031.1 hypothetical protein MJO57_07595 [Endozoicomonas sp. SCSIO W0465]
MTTTTKTTSKKTTTNKKEGNTMAKDKLERNGKSKKSPEERFVETVKAMFPLVVGVVFFFIPWSNKYLDLL